MEVMKLVARYIGGAIIFGGALLIFVGLGQIYKHLGDPVFDTTGVVLSFAFGILAIYGGHALYRWGDGQIFKELESQLDREL